MKLIIKKLLRESLLTEKLTSIDSDVDLLYTKYFEYDVERLKNTGILSDDLFLSTSIDTSILKCDDSVKSNELNPCSIMINNGNNSYKPSANKISVSVSNDAKDFIKDEFNGLYIKAVNELSGNMQITLKKEFSEEKIKGSIHHELAHWIDDTLNNRKITNFIEKYNKVGKKYIKNKNVNSTKMEIQAQIHNIKQLYNKFKNTWNDISFEEMLELSPALFTINNSLGHMERQEWIRDIKTRMHREGLLGKNMIN